MGVRDADALPAHRLAGRSRQAKECAMTGHVDPTHEQFQAFRDLPATGPIQMLNLIRFRERAAYPEGHADAAKGRSGAQAYRAYGRAAAAPFERAGGRQIWLADPKLMLIGPPDERWDLAFVAEYSGADAFVAMVRDPEYREAVVHRQAAVSDSRLIRMQPVEPGAGFGER